MDDLMISKGTIKNSYDKCVEIRKKRDDLRERVNSYSGDKESKELYSMIKEAELKDVELKKAIKVFDQYLEDAPPEVFAKYIVTDSYRLHRTIKLILKNEHYPKYLKDELEVAWTKFIGMETGSVLMNDMEAFEGNSEMRIDTIQYLIKTFRAIDVMDAKTGTVLD